MTMTDEREPAHTDPIRDRRSAQMAKEVDGPYANVPRSDPARTLILAG